MIRIAKRASGSDWFLGILLVLFGAAYPVLALNPHLAIDQYVLNTWTYRSGLPANAVNAVLQTHDGYLWLGTSAGLFRFDGIDFTRISTSPQNNKAFETITALYQTHDSSLWVGTAAAGARVLKDGKVMCYDSKSGFVTTRVRGFFESRAGHLFIATNIGLFLFQNGIFSQIRLDQTFINGIAEDPQGRIWVGTTDGVRIFNDDGSSKPSVTTLKEGLPYPSVLTIFGDSKGNMWVGTWGGLARYGAGKVDTFSSRSGLSYRILAIFEDGDGNIWIGTDKGVDRFADGVWTNISEAGGLTNNRVQSITEDRERSLWVGTANGLNQLEDPGIIMYSTCEGLANNSLTNIVQASDSSIYFFSDQASGLTRLKGGRFSQISNANIPTGCAFAARDGSIWSASTGKLANLKNGKLTQYDEKAGIPQEWIPAITEDDKSIIFFAVGEGLFRLVGGHAVPYLLKDGTRYPKDKYVSCFLLQKDGTMWMAGGNSLDRMQAGMLTDLSGQEGLQEKWISSLYDDQQGGLWIGTSPGGLLLFKNGKFTVFNAEVGLFSNEIYSVVGDDHGGIWMSSGNGIGFVERQELEDFADGKIHKIHTIVYGPADGVKSIPLVGWGHPACLESLDGDIWFTTGEGAIMISPAGFRKNEFPPHVLIEEVGADQHAVPTDKLAALSAGTDKLEFHYTGLSFKVPSRVLFKYKLEGYDHAWIDAGTRRVAYYTNLPPGNYEFLVIACNNDGVWNSTGASFSFRLKPHFYQTYWFFISLFLIVGGGAFGVYRLRVWQLLKRQKELDARIQEALAHIKTLGGLIPICSSCKKIRDDEGYWEILEKYIQTHSAAQFSHGICPDCYAKLYPELTSGKGDNDNAREN